MITKRPSLLEKIEKKIFPQEKKECLRQIQTILRTYEKESDIPVEHGYWELLNHYRSLS